MIYKTSCGDLDITFDDVKDLLRKIGNIKSFKAFFENDHKYYEEIDGHRRYYNLILFDDDGNEIWVDSNCGYPGTGPSYTEKILQLVGARDEYRVCKDKRVFKRDLDIKSDLNLLIVGSDYLNLEEDDKYKVYVMIEVKPKDAYSRYKLIEVINSLGGLHGLVEGEYRFKKYFNAYDVDNSHGEYNINQIMFLRRPLVNQSLTFIKDFFEYVMKPYCIDINIIEIDDIVQCDDLCNNR